jgi:hypothetical protein
MIIRITLAAMLAAVSGGACAQPVAMTDRTAELMQMQFRSRTTQPPPPGSLDGARASAIYKRFSEPATRGQAQGMAASTAGPGQP